VTEWTASFDLERVRPFIAAEGLNAIRFGIGGQDYDIKLKPRQSADLSKAAACMGSGGDAAMIP
jgi:hypothetical protein